MRRERLQNQGSLLYRVSNGWLDRGGGRECARQVLFRAVGQRWRGTDERGVSSRTAGSVQRTRHMLCERRISGPRSGLKPEPARRFGRNADWTSEIDIAAQRHAPASCEEVFVGIRILRIQRFLNADFDGTPNLLFRRAVRGEIEPPKAEEGVLCGENEVFEGAVRHWRYVTKDD
jgi:hypothetical protein